MDGDAAMNDKVQGEMVGRLFHYTESGIKDILKTMLKAPESNNVLSLGLPWKTWITYAVIGCTVWFLWPGGKTVPNEMWIGVLSFEGLLAALLAAVAPTTVSAGALPFVIKFFAALDAKMGERLTDEARQIRDDPTQTANTGAIRNAFIVAINTLLILPLPLVLDSRWLAPILVLSLCWTMRRVIPDVVVFAITEYAPVLPGIYWVVRSWHEQLPYCPVCKGEPVKAAWPPARTNPVQPQLPPELDD
jgi:hypothetical protein